MGASKAIIFLMITFLVLLWASAAISQMAPGQKMESFYGDFIDNCILKCEAKGSWLHSKLKHIRQEAARHCLKADFLKSHRAKLIEEMIAQEIGTKHYKINHYLNDRFLKELQLAVNSQHTL